MSWGFQEIHLHIMGLMHTALEEKGRHQDTFPRAWFTTVCMVLGNLTHVDVNPDFNLTVTVEGHECVVTMEVIE